jgi:hypothetical protein
MKTAAARTEEGVNPAIARAMRILGSEAPRNRPATVAMPLGTMRSTISGTAFRIEPSAGAAEGSRRSGTVVYNGDKRV